jgi:hypothetical protein
LIKSLDVLLINVAIRDVSESSGSNPRPMQPNPWLNIRDKIKSSRIATHMAAMASYVDDEVASYVGDDMASYMDDDMTSYVDNDVASYVDDDVASYVDNDVASFIDDDVASYMDDGVTSYVDNDVAPYVDDDVAKILSPTDTNSGPPQPISELYSSIKLAKLAHLQPIFRGYIFPTHLP